MAAELRFLLGEWDDAVPELEAGLEAAADRGALILLAQSRGYLAIVATARGDRRAAEAALEPVRAAGRYGEQVAGSASALLAEADGRPGDALDILRRIWARDAGRGDRYHHRSLAPAIVRLALAAGEEGLAREVAGATLAGAALAPGVPSVRAAALRCRGLVGRDADAALEAAALARRGGRVLEAAGACEDAAAVLTGRGRAPEARALLDEALDRYEALEAAWLAARAGAALREAGGRRGRRGPRRRPERGWASLTPSERAVAELVAEGLTNREVGRRLFVSPHTVNSHLRSAFRKLGVPSRAALAAAVVRGDHAIG
jgi:DNA-binding CsgD family transcriptional regulator